MEKLSENEKTFVLDEYEKKVTKRHFKKFMKGLV